MKIYTKTGDAGDTGLFGGSRVPKDHVRVDAYGVVDELNAALGLAAALEPQSAFADLFPAIQRDLFTIGAELASPDPAKLARAHSSPLIADANVQALEDAIDAHERALGPLKSFILPGGAPKAAALHLARTVCRRAERSVVRLARETAVSPPLLRYLNRLSDLLFVLARTANAQAGRPDIKWR
ncbi:MAG: cob(I)yrinic acid a,c-diamide adenosyltransferase [Gemmatimonadales bacterium]